MERNYEEREGILTLLQSNYTNHVLDLLHCTNRCAVRFPLIYFSHSPCQSSAVINESRGPQRAKYGQERESIPSEAPLSRNSDSSIANVKGPHLPRTRKSHLVCIVEETSQIILCYTMEKIFKNTNIRVRRDSMVVVLYLGN